MLTYFHAYTTPCKPEKVEKNCNLCEEGIAFNNPYRIVICICPMERVFHTFCAIELCNNLKSYPVAIKQRFAQAQHIFHETLTKVNTRIEKDALWAANHQLFGMLELKKPRFDPYNRLATWVEDGSKTHVHMLKACIEQDDGAQLANWLFPSNECIPSNFKAALINSLHSKNFSVAKTLAEFGTPFKPKKQEHLLILKHNLTSVLSNILEHHPGDLQSKWLHNLELLASNANNEPILAVIREAKAKNPAPQT